MTDARAEITGAGAPGTGGSEDPRVRLAAERTLLAWIRTGLATMGFGFVVARFGLFLHEVAALGRPAPADDPRLSLGIGTTLVVLGVAMNLLAAAEHLRVLGRIEQGLPYRPPRWSLSVVVAVGLAVLGGAIIVYLLRLAR
jgi:putative membrane protein